MKCKWKTGVGASATVVLVAAVTMCGISCFLMMG